ncbi:hypothetical protein F5X68DRAFT_5097 [Plectosphaerella plurivora]|uniref:Arrestin-like N-terminal domain-containing protein n=1 Tax=Plectosphaerella plurivora TaxID=936078 RepID=A0A9P9AFW0_9PEZI|nr:hypothetical protein F5X68DRAFT_5097 [Plectosphaerella plurivora]
MPQTTTKAGPELGIRLDGGPDSFSPGDTITGHVFRGKHIVTTEATLKVRLTGREKTKIIAGPSTRGIYRGRTTLISEEEHLQVLFQGPLHIAQASPPEEEDRTWSFTFTIPTHVWEGSDEPGDQAPPPRHSLPQTLPGTFTDSSGSSAQTEGFIEYAVWAELQYDDHGSTETIDAIHPITIKAVSLDPPIIDFRLTRHRQYGLVSSYRLLPEVGRAGPSFSQRARSHFGSRKVPAFAGHMEIDTPAVIQLEHPGPIPLRLQFVPDGNVLRASRIEDVTQKIQLVMLTMEIRAVMEINCDNGPGPWTSVSPTTRAMSVWSRLAFGSGTPPLYIPYATETSPVDVGEKVNLRLGYTGMMSKAFAQGTIHPSFSTRHIKYTHRIYYELQARIAEEELKMSLETDVTILPPAGTSADTGYVGSGVGVTDEEELPPPPFDETWIRPPPSG